jgi:hypothetical protein
MAHLQLSERDIERLLEGNVPPGRGDLADLAQLFARVRAGADGEQAPPMSPRLLAELDAAELSGRQKSELARAAERRQVRQARRRWRIVAVAAVVLLLGGLVFAGLRGPLGDDLRTRPGDDPVSVAEPDDSSTSTDVELGEPLAEGPDQNFGPDVESPGDLGLGGESTGGVATTEVPSEDPPEVLSVPEDECGEDDVECWIDTAQQCETDMACWEAAADHCGDDAGCRGMIANYCGDSDECREAIWNFRPRHHRYG